MTGHEPLSQYLEKFPKATELIYASASQEGYWSNLSKKQNAELMSMLGSRSTRECIESTQPLFTEMIFSDKRAAALELLQLKGTETAVDLGCMWGAITIPLAKQAANVLGVDQTIESLKFSEARVKEERLENVRFLCGNLRDLELPKDTFDVAIVNGVLEWIPEQEPVVVDDYWYGAKQRIASGNPGEMQLAFLKNIRNGLKPGGRLMLAIENRYDYKMFCGMRDPHTGTLLTTIVPRWMANWISKLSRGRDYRPWIYSFRGLEKMFEDAGFKSVKLHACWPHYHFPDHVNSYGLRNEHFRPISLRNKEGRVTFRRLIANPMEWVLFKLFNFQVLAPSIIAVGEK